MFHSIAVIGLGVIGSIVTCGLTEAGYPITAISQFRPQNSRLLRDEGLTVVIGDKTHHVNVNAKHLGELVPGEDRFDLLLVTGKSNDTAAAIRAMLPLLTEDAPIVPFQNGIIEEYLIPEFGANRIIPCVCRTGGQAVGPRHIVTHDGSFDIGELSGEITPRLEALAQMLRHVKTVDITDNIMLKRWEKLSSCGITVPTATISGYGLFGNTHEPQVYMVYARLAWELYQTACACGYVLSDIEGLSMDDWKALTTDSDPEAYHRFTVRPGQPPISNTPAAEGPKMSPSDAYSSDIAKGLPLEIGYTNGVVVKKAREHGIPAPTHNTIVEMVYEIRDGKRSRSPENLKELLTLTDPYYR